MCRRALLLVAAFVLANCDEPPPEVVEQVRAIKTVTVTEIASGQARKYSGILQATDSSALSFQIPGNVRSVSVDLGERVTKGQVLATLDSEPYRLNVKAAEAELRKARATLTQEKLEFQRQKTLFDKAWVTALD